MIPMDVTSECLAAMAHICRGLLVKPSLRSRVTRDDTLMLLLRVMTGVIILYDHIDPYGVFRKSSKLDVKSCIRLLKEQNPKNVQSLLNAIKYSTLHFSDETTPRTSFPSPPVIARCTDHVHFYLSVQLSQSAAIAYTDEEALLRQEIEELSDECCSKMSLFYAEATPLLKLISRYATQCHMVDAMIPMDVTSECLAAMAHICRGLLVKPSLRSRVTRDDTLMLLLRVMTGVIILYDHIDPYGVFRKSSKLHSTAQHFIDRTWMYVFTASAYQCQAKSSFRKVFYPPLFRRDNTASNQATAFQCNISFPSPPVIARCTDHVHFYLSVQLSQSTAQHFIDRTWMYVFTASAYQCQAKSSFRKRSLRYQFVVCSNIFIKDEEETTSVIGMQNASVLHNAAVLLDDDFLSSSCLAFHLALVPEAYVEYQPVPEADTAENLTLAEYHAASVWLYVIHVTQLVMFMSA
ncbi:hypothetical protein Aperf_G00000131542 [Anoplocephala perfoliata]